MKRLLLTTTIVVGAFYFGPVANAAITDTFCGPSSGTNCESGADQMVFLQKATGVMVGFGNVGGPSNSLPTMDLHSDGGMLSVTIDLANGFATIKPNNGISFNGLDITIPGYEFTGLVYDTQLTANTTPTFTATGYSGSHVSDGAMLEPGDSNADKEYSINAVGGLFDEVNILSTTGFDEVKHIEVDGLCQVMASGTCQAVIFPAPEPGSLGLMAIGLLGTISLAKRRRS